MEYEYKNDIEDAVIDSPIYIDAEAFDELEEVYAKAKAFNDIRLIYDKYMSDLSLSDEQFIEMIVNELKDDEV